MNTVKARINHCAHNPYANQPQEDVHSKLSEWILVQHRKLDCNWHLPKTLCSSSCAVPFLHELGLLREWDVGADFDGVVVLVQRLSLGVVLLVPLPQQPMATYHRKETQIKPLSSFKTSRLPPKLVKLERKKTVLCPRAPSYQYRVSVPSKSAMTCANGKA